MSRIAGKLQDELVPAIYASRQFRASHDTAARANLARSLERLARP